MRILQNTSTQLVLRVAFAGDGRTLVSGGGGFDVWDLNTGGRTFIPQRSGMRLYLFELDPRGRWLYFSNTRGPGMMYGLGGAGWRLFPGEGGYGIVEHTGSIAVTADGRRVAACQGGPVLRCWSAEPNGDLRLAWTVRAEYPYAMIPAVAFFPDGRRLAAVEPKPRTPDGGYPVVFTVRDAETGAEQSRFGSAEHLSAPRLTFHPDGRGLVCWTHTEAQVWDVAAGVRLARLLHPGRAHFNGLCVHPSGAFFATAGGDGCVRFWDVESLRQVRAFKWDVGKLYALAFSPDGSLAAAGAEKGRVVVWDVDV
jgi:WD40 repeat protein